MMDETPIQVLNEPDKRPESKSYVWLMRSGKDGLPPIVHYSYSPSRSGDVAFRITQVKIQYDQLQLVVRTGCSANLLMEPRPAWAYIQS